jgi:carbon storage regulator CsrA
MLVLSRKPQQQLRIGDNVTITVLRIKGNAVQIGIEAPRAVRVVRGELKPHDDQSPAVADAESEPATDRSNAGASSEPSEGAGEADTRALVLEALRRRAIVSAVRKRLAR